MANNRKSIAPAIILLSVIISIVLLPSGCQKKTSPPIFIGTNTWLGYEPLYLAQSLHYYDENAIRLIEFSSNSESIHALKNGALDAVALTLDEALQVAATGMKIEIILVFDVSNGADVILASPKIADLGALQGARVGVENTAVGAYLLSRALQKAALEESDITVVPLEFSEHESAVLAGKVDAIVTFAPVSAKILARKWHNLFDSRQIPNEIIDVLVVRPETLQRQQKHVGEIVTGWFEALQYLQKYPAESAAIMAARHNLSPAVIRESLTGINFPDREKTLELFTSPGKNLQQTSLNLVQVMQQEGLLHDGVITQPVFNSDFVHRAAP